MGSVLVTAVDGELCPGLNAGISRDVKVTRPVEVDFARDDSVSTFPFSCDICSQ